MIDLSNVMDAATLTIVVGIFYRMGMFTAALAELVRRIERLENKEES